MYMKIGKKVGFFCMMKNQLISDHWAYPSEGLLPLAPLNKTNNCFLNIIGILL